MKTESTVILNDLYTLIQQPIKKNIGIIAELRELLYNDKTISVDIHLNLTNAIKTKVQREAEEALKLHNDFGAIYMATGTGKSKVAIDRIKDWLIDPKLLPNILLVVPTEKLRDENWKEEFYKWGMEYAWNNNIERTCYASLHKYIGGTYHVILDEAHNITEAKEEFFFSNKIQSCVALTATAPNHKDKIDIFKRINVKPVYQLSLPQAVSLGISSPYDITVVLVPMDETDKYFKSGSKEKGYFYQTEKTKYSSLTRFAYFGDGGRWALLNRMKLLHQFKSKKEAARKLLDHIIPQDIRTLIFCSNIEQAIELCPRRYFSKPSAKKTDKVEKRERVAKILEVYEEDAAYNDFKNGLINRMSCVNAVNEGHNLGNIDCILVVQLDKQQLNFVQRAGRMRFEVGKRKQIIIVVSDGTIDVEWANKSIRGFDITKVKWVTLEDIRLRNHIINFNQNNYGTTGE